jgi:hypothetical protein
MFAVNCLFIGNRVSSLFESFITIDYLLLLFTGFNFFADLRFFNLLEFSELRRMDFFLGTASSPLPGSFSSLNADSSLGPGFNEESLSSYFRFSE